MRRSTLLFLALGAFTRCLAQEPIDRKTTLIIGGIKQVIWMKGDDDKKPVFLFLHGGPGNSVMSYADKFCDQLYKHFVVVHWDQREAGETARLNQSPVPLSLDIFQRDAEQLVDSLLHRFNRKKIIVAGHSWGTVLGFNLVRTRPEKIAAYIAVGAMVNQLESERMALTLMKTKASQLNDTAWTRELSTIQIPFENGDQLHLHRKGLLKYSGSKVSLARSFVTNWASMWLHVFNEASEENLFSTLPMIQCPVYFLAGRNDLQTNSALVEKYYRHVKADTKKFFWLENAGHGIPATKGKRMQEIIVQEIFSNPPDQKSND